MFSARLYNSDSPLRETRVVNMDTSQSVTRRASFSGPAEIYGQGSLLLTIEQNSASAEAEDSPAKLVQPDDKTILRSPSPPILRREDTEVIQLDTDVDTRSPPVLTRAIPLLVSLFIYYFRPGNFTLTTFLVFCRM